MTQHDRLSDSGPSSLNNRPRVNSDAVDTASRTPAGRMAEDAERDEKQCARWDVSGASCSCIEMSTDDCEPCRQNAYHPGTKPLQIAQRVRLPFPCPIQHVNRLCADILALSGHSWAEVLYSCSLLRHMGVGALPLESPQVPPRTALYERQQRDRHAKYSYAPGMLYVLLLLVT